MLVSNPRAGSVSPRTLDVIARALQSDFKLEVEETNGRDHASALAADAVDRGFDAVVAFGGDGTINEVAQPLVGSGVALGILPGGTTNVMARSLGMPMDVVEATSFVSERLRRQTKRRIGVGRINDRAFLFSAGIGLDAEVVRRVEDHVRRTGRKGDWTFVRHAVSAAATAYRGGEPWLTATVDGSPPVKGVLGICCNGWPFTYLKDWPVDACPQTRLDRRLDLLVLSRIRTTTIPRVAWSLFNKGRHVGWRSTTYVHDVPAVTWEASAPKPVQVDGDYIGEMDSARLVHVPDSLDLLV